MQHRIRPIMVVGLILLVGWLISIQFGQTSASAAPSQDGVWRVVDEKEIVRQGERVIVPIAYRTVAVDRARLGQRLASAPLERSSAASTTRQIVTLPLPDGTFGRFVITESPIMEPALAAQFPEIKTYTAQGLDDPTANGRLDQTPAGFHGMLLTTQGTVYIDPYSRNDTTHYISYYKHDFVPSPAQLKNRAQEVVAEPDLPSASEVAQATSDQALPPSGPTLRIYRLAVAATGEYTSFHGGTVAAAQAAIVTTINRVNTLYERDVAVRLVLIGNNSAAIYTNSTTDPYTNNDGSAMLDENQANLTTVIGAANYDIGHVFSTGGGGIASLGSVCVADSKAAGVTGSPNPVGDAFDVDYVAHEVGHQFGAEHTFNATSGSCGGGNRADTNAYEPASGTTIMAYGGICNPENIQSNSDSDFHTASFDQITTFITSGAGSTCGTTQATGNTTPVVNAGSDYTIPSRTPFELSGSATDANGDSLTYDWEEYDLGGASPPSGDSDGVARPLFRSFLPATTARRTFPQLANLLNNTTTLGEALPTINRTMNFRLTARDNRAGGGGSNYDTMQVNVVNTGPFQVTQPNTAVTWGGGTAQTVTWNVASTNITPVSCANVNILLSTDGGTTFANTLLNSTPNDGSQVVTVPNLATTRARVRVACSTSIFFDISDADFTITGGAAPTNTPVSTATATTAPTTTPVQTATTTPGGTCVSEGFSSVLPIGWFGINNSDRAGSTNWFQGDPTTFEAQAGAPESYAAASFNSTIGAGEISSWMLSSPVTIRNGSMLTFYTRKTTPASSDFPDRMQVRLSTNGDSIDVGTTSTSVGDFTTLLLDINPTLVAGGYPLQWQQYTITITDIPATVTGRIAFRYFVENGGSGGSNSEYIGVDTFNFCTPNSPTPTVTPFPSNKLYLALIQR